MTKAYSYIRMSTERQNRGASLARQLEASKAYADEMGWELDDSLRDIGVSAFTGKNVKDGALGQFIKLAESGKIESGSILIVESLDRISRDKPLDAINLFTSILRFGVEIVTLQDRKHYTEKSVNDNIADLYISIGVMVRANEESETKSKRVHDAWNRKRKNVDDKKLSGMCPPWMVLNDDKKGFTLIPENVAIIQRIFNMMDAGMGTNAIIRTLNDEGVEPLGTAKSWSPGIIQTFFRRKSVIGEYQPHRLIDGKRVPEGEPIKDYYPRIIEDDQYYRVMKARDERRTFGRGRKGKKFSNLFTGFSRCAVCGGAMYYKDHMTTTKKGNGTYLYCVNATRNMCTNSVRHRYEKVEPAILNILRELNVGEMLSDVEDEATVMRESLAGMKGKLEDTIAKRSKLILEFAGTDDQTVRGVIDALGQEETGLRDLIASQKKAYNIAVAGQTKTDEAIDNVGALRKELEGCPPEQVYVIRAAINAEIRKIIGELVFEPDGMITAYAAQSDNTYAILDFVDKDKLTEKADNAIAAFTGARD